MGVQSRPAQGAGARGREFWHLDHSLEVVQTVLRSSHATGPQGRPDAPCPHCGCKRTCWAMWLFGVPPPTCAPAAAGCLLGLRRVRLTAAITTAPEAGLSLSALTQLCQPRCAARVWALFLPGTPAQRGTWSQEQGSHAEHDVHLPPRTTGTILKLWAGDSLEVSPASVGSERAVETSKALLSPPSHRQAARCGHCCLLLQPAR